MPSLGLCTDVYIKFLRIFSSNRNVRCVFIEYFFVHWAEGLVLRECSVFSVKILLVALFPSPVNYAVYVAPFVYLCLCHVCSTFKFTMEMPGYLCTARH